MQADLPLDHVPLAPLNLLHVGLNVAGRRAKPCRLSNEVSDSRTPHFIFGRQACDSRA
jgi:hypothetical protein